MTIDDIKALINDGLALYDKRAFNDDIIALMSDTRAFIDDIIALISDKSI